MVFVCATTGDGEEPDNMKVEHSTLAYSTADQTDQAQAQCTMPPYVVVSDQLTTTTRKFDGYKRHQVVKRLRNLVLTVNQTFNPYSEPCVFTIFLTSIYFKHYHHKYISF